MPISKQKGTKKNVIKELSQLLSSDNCHGRYCCGGELDLDLPPKISFPLQSSPQEEECLLNSYPLDKTSLRHIQKAAECFADRNAKTWQITPAMGLTVVNDNLALSMALATVSREMATDIDYKVEAHLSKFLLYEKGCAFQKHRDTEQRLESAFATLVLELPSDYKGADLAIWSPLTPNEKTTFFYGTKSKRPSTSHTMKFHAFYNDCCHETSELLRGNRAVLVYHLTAHPRGPKLQGTQIRLQAANHDIVQGIANGMNRLAVEADNPQNFPTAFREPYSTDHCNPNQWPFFQWPPGKPKKLALVLSHQYTPAALQAGITALKGPDRAMAELIRAAAWTRPFGPAKKNHKRVPYFDAFVSLALVHEKGECTKELKAPFRTTGPLVSIVQDGVPVPFDMGPPSRPSDRNPEWRDTWHHHGVPSDVDDFEDDPFTLDVDYWELVQEEYLVQAWNGVDSYRFDPQDVEPAGNHSLPIGNHEILFASEQAFQSFRKEIDDYEHGLKCFLEAPEKVEFRGDTATAPGVKKADFSSAPCPGRAYSRAVILMWPKEHRKCVQIQTKGGREVCGKSGRTKGPDGFVQARGTEHLPTAQKSRSHPSRRKTRKPQ